MKQAIEVATKQPNDKPISEKKGPQANATAMLDLNQFFFLHCCVGDRFSLLQWPLGALSGRVVVGTGSTSGCTGTFELGEDWNQ